MERGVQSFILINGKMRKGRGLSVLKSRDSLFRPLRDCVRVDTFVPEIMY